MPLSRTIKERLKTFMRHGFALGQRLGVDILPRHFYSQIPDLKSLRSDPHWKKPMSMIGVSGATTDTQLSWVKELLPQSVSERLPDLSIHSTAISTNGEDGGYGLIEADVLYAFVLRHRPKKIVQIGCGVSTAIILHACEEAGYPAEITCVEPFPTEFLKRAAEDKSVTLVEEFAQMVNIDTFLSLGPNDFLFVDSTHTVKPGSEVNRVILEVMPALNEGVWVHFHDINFPYDYKRDLLTGDLFFWSETTLVHALLAMNDRYTIRASLSMLHYEHPEELKALLSNYSPQENDFGLKGESGRDFPSAIYLQRVGSEPAS